MKEFRIPRKLKKKLKGIYLYPPDKNGSSVVAFPLSSQKDYDAVKNGVARNIFDKTKLEREIESENWNKKYHTPISVSEKKLKNMVDDVFAEEYREEAFRMFKRAKNHDVAILDYYTFINSYNLGETNISAMCYDGVERNLMKNKK